MSLGDCRAGVRGGSGRLGASIMAQVPSVDPELGCSGSMVLARGRVNGGHRRKAAVRRLRKTSPEWGGAGVHPVPHKSRAPARSVHPVPHKSRAPARSVQAAHRKSDGPVARGRGGEGSDRAQPSLSTVRAAVDIGPEDPSEEGSTVSASPGAGVGASRAARQAACSVRWRLASRP